jgi:putative toxin-antitoxin system antitoxin component (TIGR02293 family)
MPSLSRTSGSKSKRSPGTATTADATERSLLAFVHRPGRICPRPDKWAELDALLEALRVEKGARPASWRPPPELAPRADLVAKLARVDAQIAFAKEKGVLTEVGRFLRGLREDEWLKLGDRVSRPLQRRAAAIRKRLAAASGPSREARLERTTWRAEEVLGDRAIALDWLSLPNAALEGRRPAALLVSDAGEREVRQVLGRIEGGVYA